LKKTFLGFGLGAIQSGLMLIEAVKSGNFERFVILEVNGKLVDEIRNNGNSIVLNTATNNGIIKFNISHIEIYNPTDLKDLEKIKEAISVADEMSTAIPSVEFYDMGKNSIARLLANNINVKKQQILYASENNNYSAKILKNKIKEYTTIDKLKNFQILDTVIGKMSGVIQDEETIKELNLERITPESSSAILVEEFNHIIISKINLPGFIKGIEVFVEKEELLPFEEAKLFGHNAVHSMLGFLAYLRNYSYMSEIKNDKELWNYGESAFQKESGAFLLKKFKNLDEPLFTEKGFAFYGNDLLDRMTNPYLKDEVQRICRDPLRKLGYGDRLVGTMREALRQNVVTSTLAKGVIGGLCFIINEKIEIGTMLPLRISELSKENIKRMLNHIWKETEDDGLKDRCMEIIISQYDEFAKVYLK